MKEKNNKERIKGRRRRKNLKKNKGEIFLI
jgi:hypothetical protein